MRALLVLVLAACPGTHAVVDNVATPAPGTAIAIYLGGDPGTAIAMIDDRRTLTISNGAIVLDRIDPNVQLPSLVIEALDKPIKVGACARERVENNPFALDQLAQPRPPAKQNQPRPTLPQIAPGVLSPLVRCTVDAAPGTYFVRVLQVTPVPTFRAFHQLRFTGGKTATVTTRFAFPTPPWSKQRAVLTVFEGLPGGELAPKAIARGEVVLDGTTTVLANPSLEVPARLRRIFDGAIRDPAMLPTDAAWGRESRRTVSATLELDDLHVTSGQVDVHLEAAGEEPRDVVVPLGAREVLGKVLRLGLWADDALHGLRRNAVETYARADGKVIKQRLTLSVTNASDRPRAASIEERLRPNQKRQLSGLRDDAKVTDDVVRVDVELAPGATELVEFSVTYNGL